MESRRDNSGHVMEQQDSEDKLQLCVGEDERIGDSDPEDQDDRESEAPRDSLSYKEAIVKLRARLGSSVCPKPKVKSKSIGASALDFFKDPEQVEEASLVLPQSNSVFRVYRFPLLRTWRSLLGREFKLHLTQRCFCVGLWKLSSRSPVLKVTCWKCPGTFRQ